MKLPNTNWSLESKKVSNMMIPQYGSNIGFKKSKFDTVMYQNKRKGNKIKTT